MSDVRDDSSVSSQGRSSSPLRASATAPAAWAAREACSAPDLASSVSIITTGTAQLLSALSMQPAARETSDCMMYRSSSDVQGVDSTAALPAISSHGDEMAASTSSTAHAPRAASTRAASTHAAPDHRKTKSDASSAGSRAQGHPGGGHESARVSDSMQPLTSTSQPTGSFAVGSRAADAPQPWHSTGIFASLQEVPAERSMSREHWVEVMLGGSPHVHSLADEDLMYKYGPWFRRTYKLKTSSCIGVGSTATVYSGEMDGRRVAFKVMNQSKTAHNASLFLDRSVLTELEVHHLLQQTLQPSDYKHLLVILDCQIYPPLHPIFAAIERDTQKSAQPPAISSFEMHSASEEPDSEMFLTDGATALQSRDLRFQVIMVSPLCELGGFLRLCQGKLNLPTRSVPLPALHAVVQRLSSRHFRGLVGSVGFDVSGLEPEDVVGRYSAGAIVTHLVDGWGSAHRAIMRTSQIPHHWQSILKVQVLLQVCDGLAVLHRVGVVHCDVKLDNVFLSFDDSCRPFRIAAKLGDLGMCRYVKTDQPQPTALRQESFQAAPSAYTVLVKGTPGYCAPEMLEFGRLAPATDIYSVTVLITLVLAPESEFVWHESWIMKLLPRCPPDMAPSLVAMLRKGLSFVKEERPSLTELRSALHDEMVRLCAAVGVDAPPLRSGRRGLSRR